MTECERIIKEGILPESFFKPETICDFEVSEKRKKIWAIEIDLYLEFERFCKLHNLKYWAIAGSIIGAVRHHGFIPWDDDIDVCMPRRDYETFCKLHKEFHQPYFLQTPESDPGYYISFAKLRNSNTTSVSMPFKNAPFNQGIAIDVFPLDYIDIEHADEINKEINESIMKCSSYMKIGSEEYLNDRQLENFKKYQTDDPKAEQGKIQELAQSFKKADYLGLNTCTVYPYKRLSWPTSCFNDTVYTDFHNIKIAIPSGYDDLLTICYGDYMKLPPVEKRGNWHSNVYWDPDVAYKNFLLPNGGGYNQLVISYLYNK